MLISWLKTLTLPSISLKTPSTEESPQEAAAQDTLTEEQEKSPKSDTFCLSSQEGLQLSSERCTAQRMCIRETLGQDAGPPECAPSESSAALLLSQRRGGGSLQQDPCGPRVDFQIFPGTMFQTPWLSCPKEFSTS